MPGEPRSHGASIEFELDADALEELVATARSFVADGELPSVQLALARRGSIVLSHTFGDAPGPKGRRPATDATLYAGFSTTKAVVASAVWLLAQEGRVDVRSPVARYVPEFASNGKRDVSIEHLLTHTAGFPLAPFHPNDWDDRQRRLERFASWHLEWPPGSRFAYHPASSMWVVAEVIERCAETDFREFIRERITEPSALDDLHVGLDRELHDRMADVEFVGTAAAPGSAEGATPKRLRPPQTPSEEAELTALYNSVEFRSVGVPGGGGCMTASALAAFYQCLLRAGAGEAQAVWSRETLDRALEPRTGDLVDPMTGRLANRALGVVIAGDSDRVFRGFGKRNSPAAFGHAGMGGQAAWADPATGISFAFLTNGHDRDVLRAGIRMVTMSSLAAATVKR